MEEMNSRERVWAAINHQPVDRIPTDLWATDEVWQALRARFGEDEQVRAALHIDGIADIRPAYIGPPLTSCPDDAGLDWKVLYGLWGAGLRWASHGTGRYLEQTNFPLLDAMSIDDLDHFRWPDADWFDYAGFREIAKARHGRQLVMCGYMAPVYIHNVLRGMEMSLLDLAAEPDFVHELLRRVCDFTYEYHRRIFETCEGLIDISQVTDDLGCQTGPLMSLETYRTFYAPHHKRFMALCREFGIKVFHHDDGAMRPFLPDLVEMGVDILNPVQWNCPGMDLEGLKKDFGNKICFHGGVENQRILPFGTPQEVRAEVRHCIDALAADGTGYILASCHNLQSLTPIENVIALYDEAWNYGKR